MMSRPSRRRFIRIAAAAAGLPLLAPFAERAAAAPRLHRWSGTALGAYTEIALHHADAGAARRLIARCVAEIDRLEAIFSLYRADSAVTRLNRNGRLVAPPFELVDLLAECRRFSRATDGAFDATVQPLWRLYAAHFGRPGADPAGPAPEALRRARALVDFAAVIVEPSEIRLARPGMAITLNGIAQGYVTDAVADMLGAAGIESALIDIGESRALGSHPAGRPWRVGIRDADRPETVARSVSLTGRALATSAGGASPFEVSGRFHHLLDPMGGRPSAHAAQISVIAARATTADALSTALAIVPRGRRAAILSRVGDVTIVPAI